MINYQNYITIILGITLFIVALIFIKKNSNEYKTLTIFQVASYFYLLIYSVVPIYYMFNMNLASGKILLANGTNALFQVTFLALIGYLVLLIGTSFGKRVFFAKKKNYDKKPPYKKYQIWALLSFFLGSLGILIEIQLQGGIANSIKNIELIRSFGAGAAIKDGANNPLVFFRMFKQFMIFSFFVYFLLTRFTKDSRYMLMSILTFILSSYILFIGGGRTHIIIFLVTVLSAAFFKAGKSKIKKMSSFKKITMSALAVILGVASLIVFDPIFGYLSYGTPMDFTTNNIGSILSQFSFPYYNGIFVMSNDILYRYFQDLFIWFIGLFPAFITSKIGIPEFAPLYEYNTVLQNSSIALGGIPTDIVTFGYYQLGIVGVIVVFFIFGLLVSRLDKLVWEFRDSVEVKPIILRIVIYIGMIVMYADLEGTFRNRYDVILLIVLLYDLRKYNFKGKHYVHDGNPHKEHTAGNAIQQ